MEKDTSTTPTTMPPKVPPHNERPVPTMPTGKAKKLIRKTSGEHVELFRRLVK
jgi:hypothetical protein